VLLLGVIYVSQALTPSSYGQVLTHIGADKDGLVFGEPRDIRTDEYLVLTPFIQMALRSGFQRHETISPYGQDLRNYYALPLLDWALPFKPQLWAFFFADPAFAYSAYHFALIAAFLFGYAILARQLGAQPNVASVAAVILLGSHFTQFWWSSNAATFALAPWIPVVYLARWPWLLRSAILFYVATVWVLSLVYPPFIISATFAFFILLVAFRPDSLDWRRVALAVLVACGAMATVWAYYGDVAAVMRDTIYPGRREFSGGGMPWLMAVAHLFPYLNLLQFDSLIPDANPCEVGVVSSFLPLSLLVFADHRALGRWIAHHPRAAIVPALGLGLTLCWMMLPVPVELGRLLLWNIIPPTRLLWGAGLILTLGLAVIGSQVPWRINAPRVGVFCALVLAAWLFSKIVVAGVMFPRPDRAVPLMLARAIFDWIIIVPVLGLLLVRTCARVPASANARGPLLAVVAATGLFTFGGFNPLQSAGPIFADHDTPYVRALRMLADAPPHRMAVVEGPVGGMINGLGISALNTVLWKPQVAFFAARLPEMAPDDLRFAFNRYAQIVPTATPDVSVPRMDAVFVPIQRFGTGLPVEIAAECRPAGGAAGDLAEGGVMDAMAATQTAAGRVRVVIRGWAVLENWSAGQRLAVCLQPGQPAPMRILAASAVRVPRLDVATYFKDDALALSGFLLELNIAADPPAQAFPLTALALVSHDPARGGHRLRQLPGEAPIGTPSRRRKTLRALPISD